MEISLFLIMGHYQSLIYLEENDFSKNLTLFLTILISWQIRRGFRIWKVARESTAGRPRRSRFLGTGRCASASFERTVLGQGMERVSDLPSWWTQAFLIGGAILCRKLGTLSRKLYLNQN